MWVVKTMKCVNCGEKGEEGKLLSPKYSEIENNTQFVSSYIYGSFMQKTGEMDGVSQNAIVCEPMKRALQGQSLIDPHLGHVTCPYPSVNISYLRYRTFDKETIRPNYKEYLG